MNFPSPNRNAIPAWVRWAALVWLAAWGAAYWRDWGPATFLFICDFGVILVCVGLWFSDALLISSQAVSSLVVGAVWTVDAVWGIFTRQSLTGGTEYLFDGRHALWIRMLSLFHIAVPLVTLWAMRRTGYHRRALRLQCAIAFVLILAGRLASSGAGANENINFAISAPFFRRQLGPAPLHLAITWLALVLVAYVPTAWVLKRCYRPPNDGRHGSL
ncbi:MAG: hypothetical protein WAJ92_12720 [Candidatus Acidiferrales bacterium]